ncbi:POLH, partial [Symbiodinium microadriaticum]
DREEALRVLLTQWLLRLRKEKENPTGAISVQQILSLAVSLGLNPELVNTAVFARDVAAYLSNRFDLLRTEELIVFLWAFRRLVLSQSSTAFLSKGLHKVHQQWRLLVASAELSVQRLVQLSDVLSCVKAEAKRMAPYWTDQLEELQELVIQDLTESVQYCQPETLAEILEMWAGTQEFWQSHCDFAQAITKRMEELLLECIDLQEVVGLLQAALAAPGLISTLPPSGVK